MARDLVIGLDSSTTACKAVVWDGQGNALNYRVGNLSADAQGNTTCTITMMSGRSGAQPAKLIWQLPVETKQIQIPFEFKDLAIP